MVTTQTGQKARKLSHDKIFKYLIRLFFQDFIEVLGRAIGAALDFGGVAFPSGEAFAELKKDGHLSLDFVARLRRRAGPNAVGAPVVVHSEIEGRFRSDMELRMWKYFLHLSALHLDATVVPVVLYLKGGPPGVQEHGTESRIGDLVPMRFRYLSLGLSGCLAEEWLRDKPQTLVAALAACMRSKIWDPVEHKLQCMRRVLEEKDPAKQYLLTQVVENYLKLTDDENARFKAAFAQETQAMVPFPLTFEEALVEKETRGEARGIAVGEARGIRESILHLLALRFGDVPASLQSRLAAISELELLKRVFARVAQAPSLADVEASLA